MTKANFADLRNRLKNPQAYDFDAEREAKREANRKRYPQLAKFCDELRAAGITVTVESVESNK